MNEKTIINYKENELQFQPIPKHKRFINLTGKIFGRLTVLGYAGIIQGRSK